MSDLVGNPEDRFSHNEAQIGLKTNDTSHVIRNSAHHFRFATRVDSNPSVPLRSASRDHLRTKVAPSNRMHDTLLKTTSPTRHFTEKTTNFGKNDENFEEKKVKNVSI